MCYPLAWEERSGDTWAAMKGFYWDVIPLTSANQGFRSLSLEA